MQKKWVSKKSILFSLVDYVHNRKEPGRRIFLLIIRLVWPVPAWSGTLGSDVNTERLRAIRCNSGRFLRSQTWLLKAFGF